MQKLISRIIAGFFTSALLFLLLGCSGSRQNVQPAVQKMPSPELRMPRTGISPEDNGGSLWQARSSFNGLFIDTKARNIGDIVTVQIKESAQASNKAKTATERSSGLEAGIEKLFGVEDWWQNEI